MPTLLERIEQCHDCEKFRQYCKALNTQPKACIQFKIYDYVKPHKTQNLFIAEAPPSKEPRYFYNTDIPAGGLRRGLFKQLAINDLTKKAIDTFCEANFLTDTIKCRLNKEELGHVPDEIINNCVERFIKDEIEYIQPKNIVLLGDTARRGLALLDGFSELNELRIKRDCGSMIEVQGYRVILFAYPSARNNCIIKSNSLLRLLESTK